MLCKSIYVHAGEVHLEACLLDLRTRFARVPLRASPPVVRFRESVVHPAEVPPNVPAGALLLLLCDHELHKIAK